MFAYFAADRPAHAISDALGFILFGDNPTLWQAYAFALRLCGGWALLWLLRGLWPRQRFATTMAALLFVVYPGFSQQSIALTYSTHILVLLLAIVSIGLSLRAQAASSRARYWGLTALSMLLCAAYLWLLEFVIGLEVLRLLLIAYVLTQRGSLPSAFPARAGLFFRRWLPALLVTSTFLIWRIFFFRGERLATDIGYAMSRYSVDTLSSVVTLPFELGRSLITVIVLAWANITPLTSASLMAFWVSVALGALVVLGIVFYQRSLNKVEPVAVDRSPDWAGAALVIGIISAAAGLFVPVLNNRAPELNSALDRFAWPAMIGSALVVTGFVFTFVKAGRAVLLAGMIALAVTTQFHIGNTYRAHWNAQKNMWWQFMWRVPELVPGTVLITNALEPTMLVPMNDFTLYGPLNILYGGRGGQAPFGAAYFYGKQMDDVAQGLQLGREFRGGWRNIRFEGSYRSSLIVYYDGLSCLRVIDPERRELPRSGLVLFNGIAPYSQLEQIRLVDEQVVPPETIFGTEPPHTWCYYFQRADLARQRGDWDEVARLGDEARELGFAALDSSEWLVFVEGYLRVRRNDTAREIIQQEMGDLNFTRSYLCDLLNRVADADAEGDTSAIQGDLACDALPSPPR